METPPLPPVPTYDSPPPDAVPVPVPALPPTYPLPFALIEVPFATETVPFALKKSTPPLVPFQAVGVNIPLPLKVTLV